MNDLKGRIALVTGASRGIGRSIALSLATAGADMVLNFLTRAAESKAVEAEILRLGRRCVCIQADVSVASEVQRLAGEAEQSMGAVEVLVNNAGIARQQAL
jgi:3-oxoacyl-[acyl-carrier protein] reductase